MISNSKSPWAYGVKADPAMRALNLVGSESLRKTKIEDERFIGSWSPTSLLSD